MIGEPTNPAKFAKMFIVPTAIAAAEGAMAIVGRAQNGVPQKNAANALSESQVMTSGNDWPGMALSVRKKAVPACPATQCHLRSPRLSEDWPEHHAANNP